MALLEVNDLHTSFFTDAGEVKAVDGVSFRLDHGKVLGIVGESGSGKSVTAYSVMQILAPTGKNRQRQREIRRAGAGRRGREAAALRARQPHLDYLPRPDDVPEPDLHHRSPAHGSDSSAHRPQPPSGARTGGGDAEAGQRQRAGKAHEAVPVRAVGRYAAARNDRHGAGLRAGHPDCRRADDRAGRDDSGADS